MDKILLKDAAIMNTKYYIYIIHIVIMISSCSKNNMLSFDVDPVFSDAYNVEATLRTELTAEGTGWEYTAKNSQYDYTGYMDFKPDSMLGHAAGLTLKSAKFDSGNNYQLSHSGQKVKLKLGLQTKGVLNSVGDMILTNGRLDSVFTYVTRRSDTIFFIGDDYNTELKLFKASEEHAADFKSDKMMRIVEQRDKLWEMPRFFFNVEADGKKFFFYLPFDKKTIVVHSQLGDVAVYKQSKIVTGISGIQLVTPMDIDGYLFTGLKDLDVKDKENASFDNGTLANATSPAFYKSAVKELFVQHPTNPSGLWRANNGWETRTAQDFFEMKEIYNSLFVFFQYKSGGTKDYHRIGLALYQNDWLGYSGDLAYTDVQLDDERLTFTYYGIFADSKTDAITKIQDSTKDALINTKGFYVMKTVDERILMVKADDGLSWLFFE